MDNVKRFFWAPQLGCRGLFKMTFLGHVTALSGVGVGGGSLVYANTLPIPKDSFFAGGVLGTVPLLLQLQASGKGLPRLSKRVGDFVRTNSPRSSSASSPSGGTGTCRRGSPSARSSTPMSTPTWSRSATRQGQGSSGR